MIEKDYIKKQIDLFFRDLMFLLSKEIKKEEKLKSISDLSKIYTNEEAEYFVKTPTKKILSLNEKNYDKLDIIIELLFQIYIEKKYSNNIKNKIKEIITYNNINSQNFSFRRNDILKEIEK